MKKIICIGECNYNIVLGSDGRTLGAMPGGVIACAASVLASYSLPVLMASETSADALGDIALAHLRAAGVDISAVDRYTEGRTALNVHVFGNPEGDDRIVRYEGYPDEAFDIVWPRIEEDDIVVFGGYYSLDPRMRKRLQQFIANASARKAILVYLPGFSAAQQPRITRVMPAILENLELADITVTRNEDLSLIFGVKTPQECYHDHIDFYCRSLINIDVPCGSISYYTGKEVSSVEVRDVPCGSRIWQSGALAGIVGSLFARDDAREVFENPPVDLREYVIGAAARSAAEQAKTIVAPWQNI